MNSVHFSNHTGYPNGFRGGVLKGDDLLTILEGLQNNDLLSDCDHVLTGYIGSESFLNAVLRVIDSARRGNTSKATRYVCDPVLGDDGEFYVPQELVKTFIEKLIPASDLVTPNQFEVEQLTGVKIQSISDAARACQILHAMGPEIIVITSVVFDADIGKNENPTISMIASQQNQSAEQEMWRIKCPLIPRRFTGTGDLCAALLLAHTDTLPLPQALEKTMNTMHAVIERTHQYATSREKECHDGQHKNNEVYSRELRLIQSKKDIEDPPKRFYADRIV